MRRVAGYMFGYMNQQAPKGRQREADMHQPPSAADLLRTSQTLADDVVPATSGPLSIRRGLQQILRRSLPENSSWARVRSREHDLPAIGGEEIGDEADLAAAVAAALRKDLPIAMKNMNG